jgi:hypothetical protein
MSRKITILGMGPTAYERKIDMARHVIGEVWSLNNAYAYYAPSEGLRFDRFFELHKWQYLKRWNPGHNGDHFQELAKIGCPVYVTEHIPVVPDQRLYPHIDLFTHFGTNYFLGSPSLMLALALYEHDMGDTVDEIRVFGVDTSDPSHAQQRQSWTFWLSKAIDRGIDLTGTALDCLAEPEKDEGLQGLREEIGKQIHESQRIDKTADVSQT